MNRQDVRKLFSDGITRAGLGVNVYTRRHIDSIHDMVPAAVVLIEAVSVSIELSRSPHYTCSVDVTFLVEDTYDELDAIVDECTQGIIDEATAHYGGVGCALQAMNYLDDLDAGITAVSCTWEVFYG